METRTRDLLFGTGRSGTDMRGTFAPPSGGPVKFSDLLATFNGSPISGRGRERGLAFMERTGMISAEQRAAGGSVGGASEGARYATGSSRGFVQATPDAYSGGVVAGSATPHANPVYDGLFAQSLMREQGFMAPAAGPNESASVTDEVVERAAPAVEPNAAIATAAEEATASLAASEQRLVGSFARLRELPGESHLATVGKAVDISSAAGHGDDAFGVLAAELANRPLESSAIAMEQAVDDVLRSGASTVAAATAPAQRAVTRAATQVVETGVPQVVAAAQPRLALGADDALRGVMSFSAGVDDTLRLLARL